MNGYQPEISTLGEPPNKGSNVQAPNNKDKQIEELTARVAMLEKELSALKQQVNLQALGFPMPFMPKHRSYNPIING